jgi:hypothetical protein
MRKEFYDKYALYKLLLVLIFGLSNVFIPIFIFPIIHIKVIFSLLYIIISFIIFFIMIIFILTLNIEITEEFLFLRKIGFIKRIKITNIKYITISRNYLLIVEEETKHKFKIKLLDNSELIQLLKSNNIKVFNNSDK